MWSYLHAHLNATGESGLRSAKNVTELDRQITLNLIAKVRNHRTNVNSKIGSFVAFSALLLPNALLLLPKTIFKICSNFQPLSFINPLVKLTKLFDLIFPKLFFHLQIRSQRELPSLLSYLNIYQLQNIQKRII